jgi:protein involved in polysaccharide export with SLBB domain
MRLSEFGTARLSSCIFPFVPLDGYVNNGASMRNHSSARSSLRRAMLLCFAGAACLAFNSPALRAQCSSGEDPSSVDCQMQQTAPPTSTTRSPASPTVLSMQETPQQEPFQQETPKSDRSSEASADNSLANESTYTERALRAERGPRVSAPLPPEPPTEFQRFVAASTGLMLPNYGAGLFAARPASFGPIDQAPAPQDMVIGVDDELRIRIWGQINFSANLRVSREGEIYLPKAGAVHVAGLPFSQVAGHLRTALDRVYRNFDLSVDMGEIHSIQVYVTGQARQPGEYTVSALSTLVDAVFLSGGSSGAGSMRHVQLKREGKVVTDFDLYQLLVKGDKTGDVQLQPGDVLFIPPAGEQVALLGSVRVAAIYELRGQESIEELLDASGGRTAVASGGRISVERIEDHARRRAFELAADAAGLATPLADGDIVRIDPIISSYHDAVTLRGSVANPGRFLWHAGMRLSDLMPDRDSLVTRDYWWRRTQLGLPAPEFVPSIDALAAHLEADRLPNGVPVAQSQPGPQNDHSTATQRTLNAGRSGVASALGGIEVDSKTVRQTALLRPASETDWNYAVIERLNTATMATSLIPFDLGKLVLNHDASQDLELQPDDTVTVFSQEDIHQPMDRQTKYVRLEGEFVHAGVYSVLPGETLRSLVARAGGLTDKAYLYGSEFTRKSTQAVEEQRLKEYADRLEHQLARGLITMTNLESGSSQQGGQPQQTASSETASFYRELILRLRQLQPTGRIVLNLNPYSTGVNELPDVQLEDNDQLLVPSTPATVQVVGAVPNQDAFLYRDGAHAGDYLRLAGGPNRDADRGQTFVLRADGSVAGRGGGSSIFSSASENVRVFPGDTIVVPEKSIGAGVTRTLLAWSQVIGQFGLGAAAINVLK